MDSNDVTNEILRGMWNDQKEASRTLHAKIDHLETELRAEIGGVKQEVAGVKQEVAGVKQEVAGVKQEVAGVKQEVAGVKQEVAGVKQEVAILRHDLNTTRQELGARIDDVSLEVRALRSATQGGFEVLARADARRDREIAEVRERLDRVEQHVGLRPPE